MPFLSTFLNRSSRVLHMETPWVIHRCRLGWDNSEQYNKVAFGTLNDTISLLSWALQDLKILPFYMTTRSRHFGGRYDAAS